MWIDKWEMNGTEVYLRDHSRGQPNGTIPLNENSGIDGYWLESINMNKVLVSVGNPQTLTAYIDTLIQAL